MLFFFFKQKTAYEMRISDWSSDVCSSDLPASHIVEIQRHLRVVGLALGIVPQSDEPAFRRSPCIAAFDRKRRAVDRVERHHPLRLPPEAQDTAPEVARRLIGKQTGRAA